MNNCPTPWKLEAYCVGHGAGFNCMSERIVAANGNIVCEGLSSADELYDGCRVNGVPVDHSKRKYKNSYWSGNEYPHSEHAKMIIESVNQKMESPTQYPAEREGENDE